MKVKIKAFGKIIESKNIIQTKVERKKKEKSKKKVK